MKKVAYVLMDDFVHTAKHILPFLPKYFDYKRWQVCVFKNWDDVCEVNAPDLIMDLRDARFNWRQNTPDWYESDFSYKAANFVTRGGCGYVAVHAGILNMPEEHPLRTQVLQGSAAIPAGAPTPLHVNILVGKAPGSPFDTFSDVTFVPQAEHPVLNGVTAFTVRDEQYGVALTPQSNAVVLGNTVSAAAGSSIGAWACESGKGRAVGITLGHLQDTLCNPMLQKLIHNAVDWCGREID